MGMREWRRREGGGGGGGDGGGDVEEIENRRV